MATKRKNTTTWAWTWIFGIFVATPAAAEPLWTEQLDRDLARHAEDGLFSGEVLVDIGGQVVFHRAHGHAHWELRDPLDLGGIYPIASLTKQFTATAVLMLHDRGMLSVDDPIAVFFPEMDPAQLRFGERDVTVADLLSHTSGLTELRLGPAWGPEPSRAALVNALAAATLSDPPGTVFRYSNSGYLILGEIIARAAGTSYAGFIEHEIFARLAITDAFVLTTPERIASVIPGHARGILDWYEARRIYGGFVHDGYHWSIGADGAIVASGDALRRFFRGLTSGELVTAASRERMWTPVRDGYGFGWAVHRADGGSGAVQRVGHSGALHPCGYEASWSWRAADDRLVVVLSNLDARDAIPQLRAAVERVIDGGDFGNDVAQFRAMRFIPTAVAYRVGLWLGGISVLLAALLPAVRSDRVRLRSAAALLATIVLTLLHRMVSSTGGASVWVVSIVGVGILALRVWSARRLPATESRKAVDAAATALLAVAIGLALFAMRR